MKILSVFLLIIALSTLIVHCHGVNIAVGFTLSDSVPSGPLNYANLQAGIELTLANPIYSNLLTFLRFMAPGFEIWNQKLQRMDSAIPYSVNATSAVNVPVNLNYFNFGLQNVTRRGELIARLTNGDYSFIVSPLGMETALLEACESNRKCIVVAPLQPDPAVWICQPIAQIQSFCAIPGSRRFQQGLSVIYDLSDMVSPHLAQYNLHGFKKLGIISTNDLQTTMVHETTVNTITDVRMVLSHSLQFNPVVIWTRAYATAVLNEFINAGIEVFIWINIPGNPIATSNFQLLLQLMREWNWIPKGISAIGNFYYQLQRNIQIQNSTAFFFQSILYSTDLKGTNYKAANTRYNFEMFPSTTTNYSPQVYYEEMKPLCPWIDNKANFIYTSVATTALLVIQKLIEYSGDASVSSYLLGARSISRPSLFGLLEFDIYGRLTPKPQIVTQYLPDYQFRIISPDIIAKNAVLPIPTWNERVYVFQFIKSPLHTIALAFNGIILALCLYSMHFSAVHRDSTIIKASSPVMLQIFLFGAVCMIVSNLLGSVDMEYGRCVSMLWLITCGFTIMYGALFLKTFRIHWINSRTSLSPSTLDEKKLVKVLMVIVAIDVVLNLLWTYHGDYRSERVQLDPWRPSLDVHKCTSNGAGQGYFVIHLLIKFGLLIAGTRYAYNVRNVKSEFNESIYIGFAMYGILIVLILFLTVLFIPFFAGTSTLGTLEEFMFKQFGVFLIVFSSTSFIMWKKFRLLSHCTIHFAFRIASVSSWDDTPSSLTSSPPPRRKQQPSSPPIAVSDSSDNKVFITVKSPAFKNVSVEVQINPDSPPTKQCN